MNSDEMMSETTTANTAAALRDNKMNVEALLGSPASSQQTQAQAIALAQIKANTWNTNKFREEYTAAKGRLSDQKFSITDFPDPLLPRQTAHPANKQGIFSPDADKELKDLIAKLKSENY